MPSDVKSIIEKSLKSGWKSTPGAAKSLDQHPRAAARRQAREEANSVEHTPLNSSDGGARGQGGGGRAEGAAEGQAEEPEPDGPPQSEAAEHPEEGLPQDVLDRAVIAGETATIASKRPGPQGAAADNVARAEPQEEGVPTGSVSRSGGFSSMTARLQSQNPLDLEVASEAGERANRSGG